MRNMKRLDKKYEEEEIGPRVIARHHNLWDCMGPTCYRYHITEIYLGNTKCLYHRTEIQFKKYETQNIDT